METSCIAEPQSGAHRSEIHSAWRDVVRLERRPKEKIKICKSMRLLDLLFAAGPAFGNEPVANPWLGLDILTPSLGLQLLAKLSDENSKVFGLMCRLGAPDRRQQGAVGHDFAGVARQVK